MHIESIKGRGSRQFINLVPEPTDEGKQIESIKGWGSRQFIHEPTDEGKHIESIKGRGSRQFINLAPASTSISSRDADGAQGPEAKANTHFSDVSACPRSHGVKNVLTSPSASTSTRFDSTRLGAVLVGCGGCGMGCRFPFHCQDRFHTHLMAAYMFYAVLMVIATLT